MPGGLTGEDLQQWPERWRIIVCRPGGCGGSRGEEQRVSDHHEELQQRKIHHGCPVQPEEP